MLGGAHRHPGVESQGKHRISYQLESGGSYRIDGYDEAEAFSSFLPGIGGPSGVPLWCMYVNRAQAVVSFGIRDKDHAIAEFLPATWAYQLVGTQGFRTFCKVDGQFYEPFKTDLASRSFDYSRVMRVEADRLEVCEINHTLGLSFRVVYFSPVNQPIGSLFRLLTIENISGALRRLEVLDGLPLILPAGFTDQGMKTLRRITEAYASVKLACGVVPFYSAKVVAHDEAEVTTVTQGNFYAAWRVRNGALSPIEPLVDPDIVFGAGDDLMAPRRFIDCDSLDPGVQVWENRLPCALVPARTALEGDQSMTLVALVGSSPNEALLAEVLSGFAVVQDIETALERTQRQTASLVVPAFTASAVPELDAYSRQNYLDNLLREGVPLLLPSKSGPTLLHVYSRRHGDLERDYNHFVVPPYPLSSGAGSYRDICQNRRCDIWFYPYLFDQEIRVFLELIQADGYNPFSVEGYRWMMSREVDPLQFCSTQDTKARAEFLSVLERSFHPGELLGWANNHRVDIDDREKWLNGILEHCDRQLAADGHDGGYWVDHWTYITDLLEAFADIYPDKVEHMLAGVADIGWFDEGGYVVPRSEKYVQRSAGPMQLNAVINGCESDTALPPVTAFGKLCALLAVKAVSFDYECRGIEMEAGRPGWNDSLNGLPALFGSSTCEAAEAARMATWLRKHLPTPPETSFPTEVADFIDAVVEDLGASQYCWDRAATVRETYRARIRDQVSGERRTLGGPQLDRLLRGIESRASGALERSIVPDTDLVHTYYVNKPVMGGGSGLAGCPALGSGAATITGFVQEPLPLYFEGQIHRLRLLDNVEDVRRVYKSVRASALFDKSLEMYKVNECLEACPPEVGRARTFTRGWFENESVWLHLSYKYLLELLLAGLNEEFFEDARTMLVPFMDPRVYGRSILENSSFIASSANPDRPGPAHTSALHGNP